MESTDREFSLEEIKANDGQNGKKLWIIIGGNVYDVTNYEHPGGRDILEDEIGVDRLDEFNSIGHSQAAKDQMKKYLIGRVKPGENEKNKREGGVVGTKSEQAGSSIVIVFALVLVVVGGLAYTYLFK